MKKGYWSGQVKEIKNKEKWMNYLAKCDVIYAYEAENNTGNFKIIGGGQPQQYIQGSDVLYAALVEFNSLQDAINGFNDSRYQDALSELGENHEDTVIRNLVIVEGA